MANSGAIGSSSSGGYLYPSDFIGPIRPIDVRTNSSPTATQKGSVLGATTGGSKGSGSVPAVVTENKENPGNPDYNAEIDAMYNPAIAAANQAERDVQSGYDTDVTNLGSSIDLSIKEANTEGTQLKEDINSEESSFNKTLRSALSEALSAYNALQQQSIARFGGSSSAGQAVSELAQQQFFKQQGKVQERGVEGAQEFAKERNRVTTYVKGKIDKLDQYKREALATLKSNLTSQLASIAARKGDIEANKTKDKLAILQNSMALAQQVAQTDKQIRANLATQMVGQLQTVSGQSMTLKEIVAYVEDIINGTSTIGGTTKTAATTAYKYNPYYSSNDEETTS